MVTNGGSGPIIINYHWLNLWVEVITCTLRLLDVLTILCVDAGLTVVLVNNMQDLV